METRRFAIDEVIGIPNMVIATQEILKGTFNDEIKRITALRDELVKRQGIQMNLDDAERVAAQAKADAQAAARELQMAKTTAADLTAKANVILDQARKAQVEVDQGAAKVAADRAVFEADSKAKASDLAQWSADLQAKENAMLARLESISARESALTEASIKFNKRLEALKAPV
jgi:hypothetical protein